MDYLLKQMSGRFSGVQQENKEEENGKEESGSVKDQSIPLQKSQSFKGESNKEKKPSKEEGASKEEGTSKEAKPGKEESGSVKDRSIPPQESQSFKEKKEGQNWFQRQFWRQTSHDYSSNGKIEHAAALAASAYVIASLKESGNPNEKPTRPEPAGTSLIPIKSRKEDSGSKTLSFYLSDSKRSSENSDSKVPITASEDSKTPEKAVVPAPSVKKTPSSSREKAIGPAPSMKKPSSFATEKVNLPAPSVKKPPSFVDKQLNNTGSTKRGSETPKLELPTTVKPPPPPPPSETNRQGLTSPVTVKSKADVWEEREIARINARYEKLQNTIRSWEQNQYKKSKTQNHKTKRDLDKKRKKVLETFKSEMGLIDEIVRKERGNVEEKLKKDMLKAKEMAGEIRRTGKVP